MKVAIVVQRYGADINGGAEQHARYVAEHLATHVQVEVLTTCAHRDYISWKNEFPPGREVIHGIPVHRFPVAVERDAVEFGKWSDKVFTQPHSHGWKIESTHLCGWRLTHAEADKRSMVCA